MPDAKPTDEHAENTARGDAPRPLGEHFTELRSRLITVIVSVAVMTALAWWQFPLVNRIVRHPLELAFQRLGSTAVLQTFGPTEPFVYILKLGIIAGLVLSSPILIYELWIFVKPGLIQREKRVLRPLFILGLVFFLSGAAVAYYWVTPTALYYLATIADRLDVLYEYRLSEYVSFLVKLLLAFGIAFELPLVMLGLGASGIMTPSAFMRPLRYVIVGAFVVGAFLTPPDITTQVMMATVLIALYFLGILFAKIGYRYSGRDGREPEQ